MFLLAGVVTVFASLLLSDVRGKTSGAGVRSATVFANETVILVELVVSRDAWVHGEFSGWGKWVERRV